MRTDLVRSLADVLVHYGKYRVHLAEGLHHCCAVRCFLRGQSVRISGLDIREREADARVRDRCRCPDRRRHACMRVQPSPLPRPCPRRCRRHRWYLLGGPVLRSWLRGGQTGRPEKNSDMFERTLHRVRVTLARLLQRLTLLFEPVRKRSTIEPLNGVESRGTGGRRTHNLYFASSSANSRSTVRSIWPVFCRSCTTQQRSWSQAWSTSRSLRRRGYRGACARNALLEPRVVVGAVGRLPSASPVSHLKRCWDSHPVQLIVYNLSLESKLVRNREERGMV